MASSSMTNNQIQLKLLVDNKANKVLFAEAGKDFVDFLFSLLTLPIGAAAGSSSSIHGSVGRLFQSLDRMDAPYLQPGAAADKQSDLLQLKPMPPKLAGRDLLQQLLAKFPLYTCPSRCMTMSMEASAECPQSLQPMAKETSYVLPSSSAAPSSGGVGPARPSASDESGGGGYVKGLVTYMVTDGMEVTPMTSSIALITRFSVRNDDIDLAEKVVAVGMDEGLALVEAALRSDTVLSDVFLAAAENDQVGVGAPKMDVLSRLSRPGPYVRLRGHSKMPSRRRSSIKP